MFKYWIALINSVSEIASVAHHPAVFFIQSGTDSACAKGITKKSPTNIIKKIGIILVFKDVTSFNVKHIEFSYIS